MGFFKARWPRTFKPAGTRAYAHVQADSEAAAVDAGLLRNGSMSDGTALPTGWTEKWGDVEVERDTAVYRSAPASLRAKTVAGKSGQAFQRVDAKAGTTVILGRLGEERGRRQGQRRRAGV
ncbi:MAG: hypothetical protein ACOX3C_05970 [Bacilli bacterium]